MKSFVKRITMRLSDDRGASMVEYALLVGLIAIIAVVAVGSTGSATEEKFEVVAAGLGSEHVDGGSDGVNQDPPAGQEDDSQDEDDGGAADDGNHDTAGEDEETGPNDEEDVEDEVGEPVDEAGEPGDEAGEPGDEAGDQDGGDDGSGGDTDPVDEEEPVEEEDPVVPGSTVTNSASSGSYYWWNKTKDGGNGAWKSSVTFENDWIRHQYLTLEVTRIDAKGKRTTTTVNNFYVPAGGSANFESWDNEVSLNRGDYAGVLSVEVKVTSIRTSDEAWQTVSYRTDGPTAKVAAPAAP